MPYEIVLVITFISRLLLLPTSVTRNLATCKSALQLAYYSCLQVSHATLRRVNQLYNLLTTYTLGYKCHTQPCGVLISSTTCLLLLPTSVARNLATCKSVLQLAYYSCLQVSHATLRCVKQLYNLPMTFASKSKEVVAF